MAPNGIAHRASAGLRRLFSQMRAPLRSESGYARAGLLAGILAGGLGIAVIFVQAGADGGDFSLDFIAAHPADYNHLTSPAVETSEGVLEFDARHVGENVVESLEAKDFACEDTIVFFTEVTVDGNASGAQTIDINYVFDAENNGQSGVGYKDVVAVGISNEGVFALTQFQETGNDSDEGESATLVAGSKLYDTGDTPPTGFGTTADELLFTVRVTDLEAGETVIVRVDVRFACFASDPTGNLHAALGSAEVTGGGAHSTIQVGQQDIPMLGLGQAPTATPTNTPTDTPTNTPTDTPTNTPTDTPTNTPTDTPTNTPTDTPTNTPTDTPTDTPTSTPTDTPTSTPTSTPTPSGQGCTPGYWKNHTESWGPTGYLTDQTVHSVFANATGSLGNATLLQALAFDGGTGLSGAKKILIRAAVAALLNAAHPSVDYPLTTAEVISDVNAALKSNNRSTILALASSLNTNNNLNCPLS